MYEKNGLTIAKKKKQYTILSIIVYFPSVTRTTNNIKNRLSHKSLILLRIEIDVKMIREQKSSAKG